MWPMPLHRPQPPMRLASMAYDALLPAGRPTSFRAGALPAPTSIGGVPFTCYKVDGIERLPAPGEMSSDQPLVLSLPAPAGAVVVDGTGEGGMAGPQLYKVCTWCVRRLGFCDGPALHNFVRSQILWFTHSRPRGQATEAAMTYACV